jgi:hypothetical protein
LAFQKSWADHGAGAGLPVHQKIIPKAADEYAIEGGIANQPGFERRERPMPRAPKTRAVIRQHGPLTLPASAHGDAVPRLGGEANAENERALAILQRSLADRDARVADETHIA